MSAAALKIDRNYDVAYYLNQPEWIPGRAEMEITVCGDDIEGTGDYVDLDIVLKSGPGALYRYFPFSAYIYVDNRAAAVVEFSGPFESQSVKIEVPRSRLFRLRVDSELQHTPKAGQEEQRELALMLVSLEPGATHPQYRNGSPSLTADDLFHQRAALIEELPAPVFVVGSYRSGTSILTWALGQHPNMWPLPETHWLPMLGTGAVAGYWIGARPSRSYFRLCDVPIEEYLAYLGCSIDEFMKKTTQRRMDRSQFERLHPKKNAAATRPDEAFEFARTLFGRKSRWVDGTPENAGHMALLRRLFPAARFICTVRRPTDVIASMIHFDKAGGQATQIREAAEMWRRMTQWTILGARAFGSDAVKFVSYEHVVENPRSRLDQLFDFLGEPRTPQAAVVYENRINSSSVSETERERLRPEIERYLAKTDIPRLYEDAMDMLERTYSPDTNAIASLESGHRAFVRQTLKGALPDLDIELSEL